jgi:hypothetical protein
MFSLLPAHPIVRHTLPYFLRAFAAVSLISDALTFRLFLARAVNYIMTPSSLLQIGLVPADVVKAAELMNDGGDGLSGLGRVGAITPQYYVLGIKPL